MNRRSPASRTNPAPTGAACACTVGRNAGPTPERHIARTMASANRFCAPSFLKENNMCDRRKRWRSKFCADATLIEASDRAARVRTTSIPTDRNDQRRNRRTRRKKRVASARSALYVVRYSRQAAKKKVLTRTDSRHLASIFDIAAASSAAIPGDQADQPCSRQRNPDERDRPREVDRG